MGSGGMLIKDGSGHIPKRKNNASPWRELPWKNGVIHDNKRSGG